MNNKTASIGLGTLMIFIAMMLVVAVASFVIIQSSNKLQQKAISAGDQAKAHASTYIESIDLMGFNNGNNILTDFEYSISLKSGSEPIKLNDTVLLIKTVSGNGSAILQYRGINSLPVKNNSHGYNTFYPEEIGQISIYESDYFKSGAWIIDNGTELDTGLDFDLDLINDTVIACGRTPGNPCQPHIMVHI